MILSPLEDELLDDEAEDEGGGEQGSDEAVCMVCEEPVRYPYDAHSRLLRCATGEECGLLFHPYCISEEDPPDDDDGWFCSEE